MGGDGAQAGDADQPAVGPVVGLELPDAGVGLVPASLDGGGGRLGRSPSVGVEVVVLGGGGEQEQRFAERVELELLVDPVADDVGPARDSREVRGGARGDRPAGRPCRRARVRPVARAAGRETKPTASSSSGWGPAAAAAWPA